MDVCLERGSSLVLSSEAPSFSSVILKDINLSVPDGSIVGIVGPSGAGKSSLLRLVNRLEDPTRGLVEVGGASVSSYDVLTLRRKVGMVFQLPALFDGTVEENILRYHQLSGGHPGRSKEEAREYIGRVGLSPDLLARPVGTLSVGEQQRVAIARTLAIRPEVLLLDEPTSALDPVAADGIVELISSLCREDKMTVLLVGHRPEHICRLCQRIVVLEAGSIVEQGTVDEVFDDPQHTVTKKLLRGNLRRPRDGSQWEVAP